MSKAFLTPPIGFEAIGIGTTSGTARSRPCRETAAVLRIKFSPAGRRPDNRPARQTCRLLRRLVKNQPNFSGTNLVHLHFPFDRCETTRDFGSFGSDELQYEGR
jgi:hypothetical protein